MVSTCCSASRPEFQTGPREGAAARKRPGRPVDVRVPVRVCEGAGVPGSCCCCTCACVRPPGAALAWQSGCDCHSPDPCVPGRLNTSPFPWGLLIARTLDPRTRIDKLFPLPHYHHLPSSLPSPSPNPDPSFSPSPVVLRRAVFASLRTVVCFGAFVERVNYFLVPPFCRPSSRKLSSAQLGSAWGRGARIELELCTSPCPSPAALLAPHNPTASISSPDQGQRPIVPMHASASLADKFHG